MILVCLQLTWVYRVTFAYHSKSAVKIFFSTARFTFLHSCLRAYYTTSPSFCASRGSNLCVLCVLIYCAFGATTLNDFLLMANEGRLSASPRTCRFATGDAQTLSFPHLPFASYFIYHFKRFLPPPDERMRI